MKEHLFSICISPNLAMVTGGKAGRPPSVDVQTSSGVAPAVAADSCCPLACARDPRPLSLSPGVSLAGRKDVPEPLFLSLYAPMSLAVPIR
jgi:hypothetical protein